jgi:hypothetical protein
LFNVLRPTNSVRKLWQSAAGGRAHRVGRHIAFSVVAVTLDLLSHSTTHVWGQGQQRPTGNVVSVATQDGQWQTLETGLDLGEFTAPNASPVGDSRITAVRVDPAYFKLDLLSTIGLGLPDALTIDDWTRRFQLLAAINAGMFERDRRTTTGYARIGATMLNPNWKPTYQAFLVLDPDDPKLPAATILDAECDDVKGLQAHYRVVLQSLRMVDCKGQNRWAKAQRAWSTAALAIDGAGRVLFIHARSPWPVHDFIENLMVLPMGISRAMYLEGGPEASLALAASGKSFVRVGSFETGFNENDNNQMHWALPNVIGIRERVSH